MGEARRYDLEGAILHIPLYYDEKTGQYLEDYPDLSENPVWTPQGYPVMFVGEDACEHAEAIGERRCVDCSGCRHYRRHSEHRLLGVCGNEKNRNQQAIINMEETP